MIGWLGSRSFEQVGKDGLRQASFKLHFVESCAKKLASKSRAGRVPKNGEEMLNSLGSPPKMPDAKALCRSGPQKTARGILLITPEEERRTVCIIA
jgi:hypothetical protein